MMVDYIDGAILENIQKARILKSKFPKASQSSIYFEPLIAKADGELETTIEKLGTLLYDQDYSRPENLRRKFLQFRAILSELHVLENVIVAAISRRHVDDDYANKLMRQICKEIEYPTPPPVVSCLSQHYYRVFPYYNFVCMPLLESDFLLHIPDLYHEICHPLMSVDNPNTQSIKNARGKLNRDVRKYFDQEIRRLRRNQFGNELNIDFHYVWRDSWIDKWSEEFFCDLFATLTLGSAFVWSNLHMCAKMDPYLYEIPRFQKSTHPPSAARMQAMFYALDLLGFSEEREEIEIQWNEFIEIHDMEIDQDYYVALPDSLLKLSAQYAMEGVTEVGCKLASDNQSALILSTLNRSWKQFWQNPTNFANEEQSIIRNIKSQLN